MGRPKGTKSGPIPTRRNVPTGRYVKFGDLVRKGRISLGYTQTELGKIIGISKQSMLHIEQGIFPNGKILVKLICILHLDPVKLREIIWEVDYFAGSEI